jgi:fatty acid desaturase
LSSSVHAATATSAPLDLTHFPRRSDAISWAVVLAHLAFVLAPVYLAAAVGPSLWLIPLWLWFGCFMHGLINLLHECAHTSTFRERATSDALGRWVLGPLVFADFDGYRRRHWDHHRHFGLAGDTKDAYLADLRGAGLRTLLLKSLVLAEAAKKLRVQSDAPAASRDGSKRWLLRTACIQAGFLLSLGLVAAAANPGRPVRALVAVALAYGFVYAHGLAALTTFVATLRAIAEHQQAPDDVLRVGRATLRNFACGPFERLLFGAYGFAEHATHHREPAVPSYQLRTATAFLQADPAFAPREGYLARLRALARPAVRDD